MSNYEPMVDLIRMIPPIKNNEKTTLYKRIKKGDAAAKDRAVEMYLRNALECALVAAEEHTLPLDELFSEAVLGLIEFAQRYHYTAYMVLGIKKRIEKYLIENKYVFPLPKNFYYIVEKVKQEKIYCLSKLDMGMADEISRATGLSKTVILQALPFTKPSLSYESFTLIYVDVENYVVEKLYNRELQIVLRQAIDKLNCRDNYIVTFRFGMNDKEKQSAKQIADRFHISQERVRERERMSLLKLKNQINLNRFSAY